MLVSAHDNSSSPTSRRLTGSRTSSRAGFSLVELLVVIGIIVLLVGILLVALGKVQVKSRRTQTESIMRQFANACTAFQAENDRLPGVIPEALLAANPQISSTENAVLDLLGGFRVLSPTDDTTPDSAAEVDYNNFLTQAQSTASDIQFTWPVAGGGVWRLVVDLRKISQGPIINGKPRAPYFTPGASDMARSQYPGGAVDPTNNIPDLIDAWGQPIMYLRQLRDRGPLVAPAANSPAPQYLRGGLLPYLNSTGLGELARDQTTLSILNTAPDVNLMLGKMLEHPAIPNQARGGFCLISAGPDGVYFNETDGPGSNADPIDGTGTIVFGTVLNNVKVIDEFDDIRMFGGS